MLFKKRKQGLSLEKKIELSKKIIRKVFSSSHNLAVAWTGGKDSTLLLWLIREVCLTKKIDLPPAIFIDEGDIFSEVKEFVKKISKEWGVNVFFAHNNDVSSQAEGLGDTIRVADLNERNQKEVKRIGFEEDKFPYEPESFVGNHLMKTVATNIWLENNNIEGLFVGVRWDEQGARSNDRYFRKLKNPNHSRIEPILHFREKDVWKAIHKYNIPHVSLYERGYRSLGAKTTTGKVSDQPAWEQDMDKIKERSGRKQDKEEMMGRLRDLGYM